MKDAFITSYVPASLKDDYDSLTKYVGFTENCDTDCIALIVDEGKLLACGVLCDKTIRNVAVLPNNRENELCVRIVTALLREAGNRGIAFPFLFTKPQNKNIFSSLGFFPLAETDTMLMMQRGKKAFESFIRDITEEITFKEYVTYDSVTTGCVICHANPFTMGHLHLISTAAAQCDRVLVFSLSDDNAMFSAQTRLMLIKEGTAHLKNVDVLSGGDYIVSPTTFPTYFMEDRDRAKSEVCMLDLTLFGKKIAPEFNITRRYVGEEPYSALTKEYNRYMKKLLPPMGVSVIEIPRFHGISATTVRQLLQRGAIDSIASLVPEPTYVYCKSHFK